MVVDGRPTSSRLAAWLCPIMLAAAAGTRAAAKWQQAAKQLPGGGGHHTCCSTLPSCCVAVRPTGVCSGSTGCIKARVHSMCSDAGRSLATAAGATSISRSCSCGSDLNAACEGMLCCLLLLLRLLQLLSHVGGVLQAGSRPLLPALLLSSTLCEQQAMCVVQLLSRGRRPTAAVKWTNTTRISSINRLQVEMLRFQSIA